MKQLVTLRKKPVKDGGSSLFLDYTIDGIRYKEYLKMYLVVEKTKLDKIKNQETWKTAKALEAQKIIDIQNGKAGIRKKGKDILLVDYLTEQSAYYRERGSTAYGDGLRKVARYLNAWGKKATLKGTDKRVILDFMDYLKTKTKLAPNTIYTYYQMMTTVFNKAVRDELIDITPFSRIDITEKPHPVESVREYLTLEEVQRLVATPCGSPESKRAFLFACFTGLRISDIRALTWEQVHRDGDNWQLETMQTKSRHMVYVPASDNAKRLMGQPGKGHVFNLPAQTSVNDAIAVWAKHAGIDKKITFHCSRHTFATLLLTSGVDIYTTSKLLGHASVDVTQIYAKVIDEKRRKAVDAIPTIALG